MRSQDSILNISLLVDEDAEEFAILDGIFNSEEINEEVKTNVSAVKQKFKSLQMVHASLIEMSREEIEAQALQIDNLKGIQENLQGSIRSAHKYISELLNKIEKAHMQGEMSNESLWNGFEAMNREHSSTKQELTAKLAMLQDYHVYTANLQRRNSYLEAQCALLFDQLKDANEEKLEADSQIDSLKAHALAQDKRISMLFLRHSKREEELFQEVCRNSSSMSLAQSQSQEQPCEPTTTNEDSIKPKPSTATNGEPQSLFMYTISCAKDTKHEPPVVPRRIEAQPPNESSALNIDGSEKHKFSLKTQIRQLESQLRTAKETLKIETRNHIKALMSFEEERQKLHYQNEEIQSKLKDAEEILNQSLTNESIMRNIVDNMNDRIEKYKAIIIKCAEDLALTQLVFNRTSTGTEVDESLFYNMLTNIRMALVDIARDRQVPLAAEPASDIHEDVKNIQQKELELAEVKEQISKLDAEYDAVSKELKTIKSKRIKSCANCVNLSKRINDLELQVRIGNDATLEFYRTHCDYQTRRINELEKEIQVSDAQVPDLSASQEMNDYLALRAKYRRMKTVARMRRTEIEELKSRLGFDPAQGPSTR